MRIRFIILCIVALLSAHSCFAQNLIRNGDFETHTGCPNGYSQLGLLRYWQNPTNATPDYWHMCATNPSFGVPSNVSGYQPAHSDSAYAGILLYVINNPDYREYIQARFSVPLIAGALYHFEMYVSNADSVDYQVDEIGVYFSNTPVLVGILHTLPFTPQIVGDFSVVTSIGWTSISADYTAHGGEKFLVIGNFKPDSTTTYAINGNTANPNTSYTYIDDVSLVLDSCFLALSFTTSASLPLSNTGTVSVIVSTGTPPYQYSLDSVSFQQSNTFTALGPGIYQMFIVDSNGCTAQAPFVIDTNCPAMLLAYNIADAVPGVHNGAVDVSVIAGQAPYTYSLDSVHFQRFSVFTGLDTGTYSMYVVDATGCPVQGTFTVGSSEVECPPMTFEYSITDAVPGSLNGAVKVLVDGGAPPYRFSIDSVQFQASNTFASLDTGTYQVFLIDSNGCTAEGAFTIDVQTAIDHVNGFGNVRVYPNPFNDELVIEPGAVDHLRVRIFNVLGQTLYSTEYRQGSSGTLVIKPALSPGTYFLRLDNSSRNAVYKVVKHNP